jgi:cobalt-zinc-cadmium efflux system protein
MEEHHHHHHSHAHPVTSVNEALVWGIVLNTVFVIVEVIAGFSTHSLGLLTDAGHNASDVAGLLIALVAFKLAGTRSNASFSFGYRKSTVVASLINSLLLLLAMGAVGYEALTRLNHPEPLKGGIVAIVAGLGILINAITAGLLFGKREKDINMKAAYLHMVADALISLGVVVAGVIIYYTGWFWMDSLVSIIIIIIITVNTWSLLKDSIRLSMDGVPLDIDIAKIKKELLAFPGVRSVHHIHIWAISTTENAFTGHLVVGALENTGKFKDQLRHKLLHFNIHHTTFELEQEGEECKEVDC